jgi:hypothetical protein
MRILVEICLTICEWVQECNIQRWARRAARRSERKTVFTFLSQAAVGAVLALFVQIAGTIVVSSSGQNGFLLALFPFYSIFYATAGAIVGVYIWLLETGIRSLRFVARTCPSATRAGGVALLNRILRFVARTLTAMVVMSSLFFGFFSLVSERGLDEMSYSYWIGFSCTTGFLIGLTTGSSIRTCRAIIFGVDGRRAPRNLGTGISIPFGVLLRVLSVFGLAESLLTLALWFSNLKENQDWFPVREQLPAIVWATSYFAISSYLSFRSPRKRFLLPLAVVLNAPVGVWIADLFNVGTASSQVLAYTLLTFICLWVLYLGGRLISPEPSRIAINCLAEPRAQRVTVGRECTVHL